MVTILHPDTFSLQVTNIALGVATLMFCLAVTASALREIIERLSLPRIHPTPAEP
jgi:hypothetical protein